MAVELAAKTKLRNEILRIMREDLVFEVIDGDSGVGVDPNNIHIHKEVRNRAFESNRQFEEYPSIAIVASTQTQISPDAGESDSDLWIHQWLIQILDADLWDNDNRIATWEKWQEQIASKFHYYSFDDILQWPAGCVKRSLAQPVDDIDEKLWVRHGKFVMGIVITVETLQSRGTVS